MISKRILLFGGNGQIGTALAKQALPSDWHLGVCTRAQCDLSRTGSIGKALRDFAPDLVINAAAMTDVDACEKDPAQAMRINFEAVAAIAAHCTELSAPLIHISTDYVFDGTNNGRPYLPDDAMNPVNDYGKSKMMGEEAVRHGIYWHVILRTSLVFSAYGQNTLVRTLRQIDTQNEIQAASDQVANPTSADAVAAGLVTIGDALLRGKSGGFGTFHLCGEPAVSRYEFVQAIMDSYAPFTARRPSIIPVKSADIPGRAPRPAYSALNYEKICSIYGIERRSWHTDLERAIKSLTSQMS